MFGFLKNLLRRGQTESCLAHNQKTVGSTPTSATNPLYDHEAVVDKIIRGDSSFLDYTRDTLLNTAKRGLDFCSALYDIEKDEAGNILGFKEKQGVTEEQRQFFTKAFTPVVDSLKNALESYGDMEASFNRSHEKAEIMRAFLYEFEQKMQLPLPDSIRSMYYLKPYIGLNQELELKKKLGEKQFDKVMKQLDKERVQMKKEGYKLCAHCSCDGQCANDCCEPYNQKYGFACNGGEA